MSSMESLTSNIDNLTDPILQNITASTLHETGNSSWYYDSEDTGPHPWNIPKTTNQQHWHINRQLDFQQLVSSGAGQIRRLLRSTFELQIPAKSTCVVNTQMYHPCNHFDSWYQCNYTPPNCHSQVINKIQKLENYWLVNEINSQFIIKEGELSPRYNGRIQVIIFS